MDDLLIPAYVTSSAALLGIPMSAARIGRVAAHMQRTAAMAALLEGTQLVVHEELAEIYSPAAFPGSKNGGCSL